MKKKILLIVILITIAFAIYEYANAGSYVPLTPIPGITSDIPTTSTGGTSGTGFASYLRALYVWGVAAASGLAVVMIMWGGVEYMTSAGGHGVEEAKKRISSAIAGLLLALGSYIILYTVNRDLLNLNFAIGTQTVDVNGNAAPKFVTIDHDPNTTASGGTFNGDGNDNGDGTFGGGSTGVGGGTLLAQSFPNQALNDFTMQMVQKYGLDQSNPSDAEKYFPDGQVTAEGWVSLLASIVKTESGFNPTDNNNHAHVDYYEYNPKTERKDIPVYSEGLYSLSEGDAAVKQVASQYGVSVRTVLSDANLSTEAAVIIMKNQIEITGRIQGSSGYHYWGPLFRDEVFR